MFELEYFTIMTVHWFLPQLIYYNQIPYSKSYISDTFALTQLNSKSIILQN